MDIPRLLKLLNERRENAKRTHAALKKFGYDVTDLSVDELLEKKALFRGYAVEADIHPFLTGISSFDEIWSCRVPGAIGGVPVSFADLKSLIKMKEAAGRPKDLEDLKYLRELKKGKSRP